MNDSEETKNLIIDKSEYFKNEIKEEHVPRNCVYLGTKNQSTPKKRPVLDAELNEKQSKRRKSSETRHFTTREILCLAALADEDRVDSILEEEDTFLEEQDIEIVNLNKIVDKYQDEIITLNQKGCFSEQAFKQFRGKAAKQQKNLVGKNVQERSAKLRQKRKN
eukprot:Lithocolla_globosa_v1_NODE_353_length_4344_cov_296.117277.p3 type:complete len:164 gc:universal NODE_353_length_4344_cov_296.117277:3387-3878(+)